MLSPLALPPLKRIGRWTARKVHGNARSAQGYLLTKSHWIDEDQEWQLGQSYLGMLGLPVFPIVSVYLQTVHLHTGYWRGNRHVLGHWSDLPLDLKILLPLTFICHFAGLVSAVRAILVWKGVGSRKDLGE